MIGGAVNGGRMLGAYPDDLTDSGTLNIGRGRLIPTTAWEQLWQPLAQWFACMRRGEFIFHKEEAGQ